MGKSAKMHKRVPKKTKSPSSAAFNHPSSTSRHASALSAQSQSNLKAKAESSSKSKTSRHVNDPSTGLLGGADYVSMMMGGRRKARAEAQKVSQDSPPS